MSAALHLPERAMSVETGVHLMGAEFNWLEEYGPHWEPNSTAFWLEPRKVNDLEAWLAKYRPEFWGEMTVGNVTVNIPRKRDYLCVHRFAHDRQKEAIQQAQVKALQQSSAAAQLRSYSGLAQSMAFQNAMMQNAIGLGGLNQYMGKSPFKLRGVLGI